jgi:hypothetical protein
VHAPEKTALLDREDAAIAQGTHGGGAWLARKQRHLAEDILLGKNPEQNLLSLLLLHHLNLARLHYEHAIAGLAFADDHLTIAVEFA